MIWFNKQLQLADIIPFGVGNMCDHVGIEFTEVGDNFIKAKMPVDQRTKQPYGLLHGGASAVLAETLGSIASAFVVDAEKNVCVGMEINANHIRSARSGYVTGTCTPIHIGAQTHVWDIKIHNEADSLCCISRLTVSVLKRR